MDFYTFSLHFLSMECRATGAKRATARSFSRKRPAGGWPSNRCRNGADDEANAAKENKRKTRKRITTQRSSSIVSSTGEADDRLGDSSTTKSKPSSRLRSFFFAVGFVLLFRSKSFFCFLFNPMRAGDQPSGSPAPLRRRHRMSAPLISWCSDKSSPLEVRFLFFLAVGRPNGDSESGRGPVKKKRNGGNDKLTRAEQGGERHEAGHGHFPMEDHGLIEREQQEEESEPKHKGHNRTDGGWGREGLVDVWRRRTSASDCSGSGRSPAT